METKLTFLRDSKNFPEVLDKSIFVLNKLEIEFSLLPGAKFTLGLFNILYIAFIRFSVSMPSK